MTTTKTTASPHIQRVNARGFQVGPDYIRVMAVFVTDQCNLACVNCCAETVKTNVAGKHLSWEDFKSAIKTFMDPTQFPYEGRKVICIEGGETFLVYPLIKKAVEYASTFPTPPHIYIHTNGTLVRPEWVRQLREYDVEILFSIDGDRAGNDRYRKFPYGSERSVWDVLMKRLEKLPKEGLGVNVVIRPESLPGMIRALKKFSELRMPFVNLAMDYYYIWNKEQLKQLETFFDDFYDFYVGHTKKTGEVPFLCGAIHDALNRVAALKIGKPWWQDCVHVILGADGHFYACESIGMFNWDKVQAEYSLNHAAADKGIDWEKRNKWMDDADALLGENGRPDKEWQHMCPRLYWQVAEVKGTDPTEVVNMMHTTSRMFVKVLMRIATELKDNPSFIEKHVNADVVQGS